MAHEAVIQMAHGAGGKMSEELMKTVFLPIFGNEKLDVLHDGAKLAMGGNLAFTTDSYVISPRFFPSGNIGKLAVCGTVNDLAMTGAVPKYITCAMILEEGLPIAELKEIARTMQHMADEAGVAVVTGDTKVVERGKADGIYINTAGIGELIQGADIAPKNVTPGMKVLLSGCLGDHAATVLAKRHGLSLPDSLMTDCAPLGRMVQRVLAAAPHTACLRDPTRGGAAAALNEIAMAAKVGIKLEEDAVPVHPEVQAVADILGFDPLYLANEGKCIAFVPADEADAALQAMKEDPYGREARVIGETTKEASGIVALETAIGGLRIVDMPLGALVPRIC